MKENNNAKESKKKILYIVVSIIASISLWAYVTYVQNPDKTVVIDNIGVEYVGAEVLMENNLIVTNVDTDTLTLTFSGKRNTLTKLDGAYITATVDLEDIVETYSATAGVYQLGYDLDYGGVVSQSAVSVSNTSKNYVSVTVEKLISTKVPVEVKNSVVAAAGYIVEKEELSVRNVVVSGPQSVISNIESARVEITREDVSKSIVEDVPITLVDANGDAVDTTYITTETETVAVTIPVMMLKNVPLTVEYIDTPNVKGTLHAKYDIEPEYVTLSGEPEILDEIDKIVLGTIDLASFETEVTKTFIVDIPDGVKNVSGEKTAQAEVTLPDLRTKVFTVNDIQFRGVPVGKEAEAGKPSVEVTLRGTAENLNKVTASNISVVADVSGYDTDDSFAVLARVSLSGTVGIDIIGDCKVEVSIK